MRTVLWDRHSHVHRALRQSLMQPFFKFGLAAGALLLLGGWAGWLSTAIFPWDALTITGLSAMALLLQRYGLIEQANSWFIVGLFWAVSFNLPFYGINHPITALFLPIIVLSGLLLGRIFQISIVSLCSLFVILFAITEYNGWEQPVAATIAVGDTPALIRSIVFWVSLFNLTGWLVYVFAEQLERATTIARGQTQAFIRITELLNDNPALERLIEQVLQTICEQLHASQAMLWVANADQGILIRQLAYPKTATEGSTETLAASAIQPLWAELSSHQQPIAITDVAGDHRLRLRAEQTQRISTVLALPLVRDTRVNGAVVLTSNERRTYLPEEIELAKALVHQITLAMQLDQLAHNTRTAAIAQERNRMAREIHDTLAQGLTGIIVQLEAAEDILPSEPAQASQHIRRAQQLARESLNEARRSVMALTPQALEQPSLGAAIERIVAALTTPNGPTIIYEQVGQPRPLAPARAHHLLRIGQEALTNALKHATAQTIRVQLCYDEATVSLLIADDGRGFKPERVTGGFGLIGMHERAALVNATLTIASQPSQGTHITVRAPYE